MRWSKLSPLAAFSVLVLCSPTAASAADADIPREWHSVVRVAPIDPLASFPNPIIYASRDASRGIGAFVDGPDVAVTTASNTTQSENSLFVSPLNPSILLNSNNSSDWPVTQIFGCSYWVSTNGGASWTGSTQGAGGTNRGDPSTAINRNGRMFIGGIAQDYGQFVARSDDNGASWTSAALAPGPFILDKNHMTVDNSTASPNVGNLYSSWTNIQGGAVDGEIELMRSTDGGVTWTSRQTLSAAILAGSHNQGVNIQTGPGGQVYVVWTIYDCWPCDETALGLAVSTNGGASFPAAQRIVSGIRGHRNTPLGGGKTMRHNSFPSMTVNQQTGQIFVVWTNIGVPGVNTGDADIYMVSSTNGGASWSAPVRVNQDPIGNGRDQYFPWIACDPSTGLLACIYCDSRDFAANDMVETWVSTSTDNGATWQDGQVSDVAWSGDGIPGFSGNYAGDYLGISVSNNTVTPCWMDTRTGNALTYVSPFSVAPPGPPVANFSGTPTVGAPPLAVQFTDLSTNAPTSWAWDFGDGGSSTAQNPSHTYNADGSYTVSLTATNGQGSDNETKVNYITVTTAPTPNIHVQNISVVRVAQAGNQWRADASVTIVDETGAPVSAATVSGFFNAPNGRTRTGTTNASGVAVISSAKTKTPPANWCFTVTNVTKTGETYDPSQNVETSDCETAAFGPVLAADARAAAPPALRAGIPERADIVTSREAEIEFTLEAPAHLRVEIFDVSGRKVATLADRFVPAGDHGYTWDSRGTPSGIYLYRVHGANLVQTGKILVLAH